MKTLHKIADEILFESYKKKKVDISILFREKYYGKIEYSLFSDVIGYLIKRKFVLFDQNTSIATITDAGRDFVKTGAFDKEIQNEINEYVVSDQFDIDDYEERGEVVIDTSFDDIYYDNKWDNSIAKRKSIPALILFVVSFAVLFLIKYMANHNPTRVSVTDSDRENIRKMFDSVKLQNSVKYKPDSAGSKP